MLYYVATDNNFVVQSIIVHAWMMVRVSLIFDMQILCSYALRLYVVCGIVDL